LSFVVAANVLAAAGRRRTDADPVTLMTRLASVLEPFGLSGRAGTWLDWTLTTVQSAA